MEARLLGLSSVQYELTVAITRFGVAEQQQRNSAQGQPGPHVGVDEL